VSKQKPTNPNPIHVYIFKTKAKPLTTTSFVVKERGQETSTVYLSSVDRNTVGTWMAQNYIDKKTKEQLENYLNMTSKIREIDSNVRSLEDKISSIFKNQERLRANLHSLGNSPEEQKLRQKYVSDMTKDEGTLTSLQTTKQQYDQERRSIASDQEKLLSAIVLTQIVKNV